MLIIKDTSLDFQKLRNAMISTESDKAFNTYYLAEAEVEIQTVPLFGIINIYANNASDFQFCHFIKQWKKFETECGETKNKAYYYSEKEIFPFGYIRKIGKVKRKIEPVDNMVDILTKKIKKNECFTWYVNIIDTTSKGALCCHGLNYFSGFLLKSSLLLNQYLTSSVSTIIYDLAELFQQEIKQLDFPRIDQYALYKRGNIIADPVCISTRRQSVTFEFISYYLNQQKTDKDDKKYVLSVQSNNFSIPYDKIYIDFITDGIDHSQEYINDRCFILGCPLFGECVRIDLKYRLNGKLHEKYIMLSSLVINPDWSVNLFIFENFKFQSVKDAILSMYRDRFCSGIYEHIEDRSTPVYLGSMLRGMYDIIPNMKCSQNKKNLLEGILMNGFAITCEVHEMLPVVYVVNQNTNQIFIGMRTIRDVDIMKYARSSTVIFACDVRL